MTYLNKDENVHRYAVRGGKDRERGRDTEKGRGIERMRDTVREELRERERQWDRVNRKHKMVTRKYCKKVIRKGYLEYYDNIWCEI